MDSRRKRQPRGVTHELVIPCDSVDCQRNPSSGASQYEHLKPIRDGKNRYETASFTRHQPHENTTSFGAQPLPDSAQEAADSSWRSEEVTEQEQVKYEEPCAEAPNKKAGGGNLKQISKCCEYIHATGLSHHQMRAICAASTAIAVSLVLLIPVLTVAVVGYVQAGNTAEREQDLRHTSQQMAQLIDTLRKELNMTRDNFTERVSDLFADVSSQQSTSATQYDQFSSDIHQLSGDVERLSANIQDLTSVTSTLLTTTRQHTSQIDTLSTTKASVTTFNSQINSLSSRISALSSSKASVATFNYQVNRLSSLINGLTNRVTRIEGEIERLSANLSHHTATAHSCSCN